jgi:hypothetical protein
MPRLEFSSSRPCQGVEPAPQHHLRAASGHKRNLRVVPSDPERPNSRRVQANSACLAVEVHGRAVTANILAATFYRQAQQAADASAVVQAIRQATVADPSFGLAFADLAAIGEAPPGPTHGRPPMSWERHHIEVVLTAAAGDVSRATDLLREHLTSVGCDPLAVRIVTDLLLRTGNPDGLEDLCAQLPRCHRAPAGNLP